MRHLSPACLLALFTLHSSLFTLEAATGVLEDLPNTAPVVTNEEDAVAMAAVGALGGAVSNKVDVEVAGVHARIDSATNVLNSSLFTLHSSLSNHVDATYAKRSEIPAAPDLAPYALKSELPTDYLRESDITNFATRAWIASQGYATGAGMTARLDAQDLAIDAATNFMWLAHLAEAARLNWASNALWLATASGTNRVWQGMASASNRVTAATNAVMAAVRSESNRLDRTAADIRREIDGIRTVAADSNAVTRLVTEDGLTWQDATGVVWRVESRWVCTNATEEWAYTIGGETYTREQMIERAEGEEDYSQTLKWEANTFGEDEYFEGWFVLDGSGTAPVGYNWDRGDVPSYASDTNLAEVTYGLYGEITATRGERVTITNAVNRVAYTNEVAETAGTMVSEAIRTLEEMGTVLAATRLVDQTGGGYDDVTPETVARKQDALPYPTNAIPYAAIDGAPSGGGTPSLAGQTFDFSRNYDIIRATAAIAEALGATVTNNPTAQGGN